jgi:hypothetical protein
MMLETIREVRAPFVRVNVDSSNDTVLGVFFSGKQD